MKRWVFIAAMLFFLAFSTGAGAGPPEFSGGVNNEYEYEEVVFITGEPVKFRGILTINERERQTGTTVTYNFKLTSVDPVAKGTLDRNITYLIEHDQRSDKGQTITRTTLQGTPRETIVLNGLKYTLKDYQFSKSDIIDNRPAADFSSGNITGRKLFELDGGRGAVLVEFNGGSVGYENFWGSTETQILDFVISAEELLPTAAATFSPTNANVVIISFDQPMNGATLIMNNFSSEAGGEITGFNVGRGNVVTITFENELAEGESISISSQVRDAAGKALAPETRTFFRGQTSGAPRQIYDNWQGTYRSQVSDSMTKTMHYQGNEAHYSSFAGGYLRVINSEMVAQYNYNLPKKVDGLVAANQERNNGTVKLAKEMAPNLERLIVPKFRDLGGHWAEDSIERLYSLDVFDQVDDFFIPNVPITRIDFTKAVMRASNIRLGQEELATNRRNAPPEVSPFSDMEVNHPDYRYVKDAVEKGIVYGMTPELFKPLNNLTRAQAITILIRALGFEHQAPTPGYYTSFNDDHLIPYWARDSIYMAQEIGLIMGDNNNNVNADKPMTRAEASAMLIRFLEFLERDLQRDYRENILLF